MNSSLAAVLGPALLGAAAAAYLGGGAAGADLGAGALVLLDRGKEFILANAPASAATAAVVGVAGITAIAVVNRGPEQQPATAEPSVPGPMLPSFTTSDQDPGRDPVTAPAERTERRDRANAELDAVPGTPGITTPTPATALLASEGDLALETGPDEQAGTATGQEPGQNTQPGGGQGPGGSPGSTPRPSPKPSPKPSPDPSPDPSTEPSPSEPPGPRADVGVTAWQGSQDDGRARVWARVSGVPSGKKVRLTATASTGNFNDRSWGCYRSGRGYVCTATRWHTLFGFDANVNSRPTVTFRVTAPAGSTDPSPGNNSASVQVTGGRGSSG